MIRPLITPDFPLKLLPVDAPMNIYELDGFDFSIVSDKLGMPVIEFGITAGVVETNSFISGDTNSSLQVMSLQNLHENARHLSKSVLNSKKLFTLNVCNA